MYVVLIFFNIFHVVTVVQHDMFSPGSMEVAIAPVAPTKVRTPPVVDSPLRYYAYLHSVTGTI